MRAPPSRLAVAALCISSAAHYYTVCSFFSYAGYLVVDAGWAGSHDESGYVAGWLAACLPLSRLPTSALWGRAADRFGRRAIMIASMLSLGVGNVAFGFSTNLWAALLVRLVLLGGLNGQPALMGLICGELGGAEWQPHVFSRVWGAEGAVNLFGPAVASFLYGRLGAGALPALAPSQAPGELALAEGEHPVVTFLIAFQYPAVGEAPRDGSDRCSVAWSTEGGHQYKDKPLGVRSAALMYAEGRLCVDSARTLGGSVEAFGPSERAALRARLRASLGCEEPACRLELRVAAGSVSVDALLTIPAPTGGNGAPLADAVAAAASTLAAQSTARLSESLGVAVQATRAPTVQHNVAVPLVVAPPPPPPPLGLAVQAWHVGVGVAAGLVACGVVVGMRRRRASAAPPARAQEGPPQAGADKVQFV